MYITWSFPLFQFLPSALQPHYPAQASHLRREPVVEAGILVFSPLSAATPTSCSWATSLSKLKKMRECLLLSPLRLSDSFLFFFDNSLFHFNDEALSAHSPLLR